MTHASLIDDIGRQFATLEKMNVEFPWTPERAVGGFGSH